MNRKEAFAALFDGKKIRRMSWKASWPGMFMAMKDIGNDTLIIVSETGQKTDYSFPNEEYEVWEAQVSVTATTLGNALASEGKKVGLSDAQISSVSSGLKSSLGL